MAIRSNQGLSEAIKERISGHQTQSDAIRRHQAPSGAIRRTELGGHLAAPLRGATAEGAESPKDQRLGRSAVLIRKPSKIAVEPREHLLGDDGLGGGMRGKRRQGELVGSRAASSSAASSSAASSSAAAALPAAHLFQI